MPEFSSPSVLAQIENLSGTRLSDCYQCGKCTAGCPMGARMDVPPTRIIRFLQIRDVARALTSESIWECVSCQTCSTRCPKNVDCAGIMDAVRQVAYMLGTAPPARRRVLAFQEAFLENIRRYGRLRELDLTMRYKLRAFQQDRNVPLLFKDGALAPELLKRGKLHFPGGAVRDRGVVERIFERCRPSGGAR